MSGLDLLDITSPWPPFGSTADEEGPVLPPPSGSTAQALGPDPYASTAGGFGPDPHAATARALGPDPWASTGEAL